ncbi:hypothetical protein ABZ709_08015 [Streptomyces albus]|uniref:hypothetical protein n=1 Tax=Streptomyces albus TaxID=1888 RepID=UPI0033FEC838
MPPQSLPRRPRRPFRRAVLVPCLLGLFGVLALLGPLAVLPVAGARAAAAPHGEVTLPVQRYSTPLTAVASASWRLSAGDRLALHTPALRFAVGSWGAGRPTNIGTTLLLACTDPEGRRVLTAHDGANLTPREPDRLPAIRALLVARGKGEYRCTLGASAYSTAHAKGMTVRLTGRRTVIGTRVGRASATWTRPAARGDLLLRPGRTAEPMNGLAAAAGPGAGRRAATVAVDAEITTCNADGAYRVCRPRDPRPDGSAVTSWVEVRRLDAASGVVGAPVTSRVERRRVSAAQHHAMLHHTLRVPVPARAERLDVRLKVRVDAGDDMVFHAGYGYARTVVLQSPAAPSRLAPGSPRRVPAAASGR